METPLNVLILDDIEDDATLMVAAIESEVRFRSLVENSYDVICMFDATGTPTYVSPSISRVLGYEPAELVGRGGLEIIHPDDIEKAGRLFAEGLSIG